MKGDQPNTQTPCSSAYQNQLPKITATKINRGNISASWNDSFRVTNRTLTYILNFLTPYLQRDTHWERSFSPDKILDIFLYGMGKVDYVYTVAKLFGVGDSTVFNIGLGVPKLLTEVMWEGAVHFLQLRKIILT